MALAQIVSKDDFQRKKGFFQKICFIINNRAKFYVKKSYQNNINMFPVLPRILVVSKSRFRLGNFFNR